MMYSELNGAILIRSGSLELSKKNLLAMVYAMLWLINELFIIEKKINCRFLLFRRVQISVFSYILVSVTVRVFTVSAFNTLY